MMKTKEFYKKILSKKIPLVMIPYGFLLLLYMKIVENFDTLFFCYFIFVLFSLTVIVECINAFFKSIILLIYRKIGCSRKIFFRILVLPYLPPILGTFIYGINRIIQDGILYKREVIIILGITLLINFICVMIYNCKTDVLNR